MTEKTPSLRVGDLVSMWLVGGKTYGIVLSLNENESGCKYFEYYHFNGNAPGRDTSFGWNYIERLNRPVDPTNGYPERSKEKLVEVVSEAW